jgi:hypothetical protein
MEHDVRHHAIRPLAIEQALQLAPRAGLVEAGIPLAAKPESQHHWNG